VKLRLGSVAYLNMQPLVYGAEALAAEGLELREGPPSSLARWLAKGAIDVGMVPVASLLRHPEWRVAGRSMIGSRGPVRSVLVLGAGEPREWRVLRPDSHSMTSNALAQVILRRRFGLDFELGEPIPLTDWQPPEEPAPGEAMVMIGTRALRWGGAWAKAGKGCVLDLGEAWADWTGLPFVYAVWAVRPGVELGDWPERLEGLKESNRARLPQIAQEWAQLDEDGLSAEDALQYVLTNIHYDLDDEARAGLARFHAEGLALGLFNLPWQWNPCLPD
jgi:chorismate dehydratase